MHGTLKTLFKVAVELKITAVLCYCQNVYFGNTLGNITHGQLLSVSIPKHNSSMVISSFTSEAPTFSILHELLT